MPDTKAQKIDHIGIAVSDLEAAVRTFTELLGAPPSHTETIPAQKVQVAAFRLADSAIELLQGTAPESVISRFVAQHGEGLHHVCIEVGNLAEALHKLRAGGLQIVNAPSEGAGGTRVAFVHPRSAHGVLFELVEYPQRGKASGEWKPPGEAERSFDDEG